MGAAVVILTIVGHPPQNCREKVVYDAVEQWAYGGTPTPYRKELAQGLADVEGLLLLIRFPLMSHQELEVPPPSPPPHLYLALPRTCCPGPVAPLEYLPSSNAFPYSDAVRYRLQMLSE